MFGIGGFELFIIVVFIFVIFGPDKLPQVIKLAGLGIKKFKKAKVEMDKVLKDEIVDPVMEVVNAPDEPKKTSKSESKVADNQKKSSQKESESSVINKENKGDA